MDKTLAVWFLGLSCGIVLTLSMYFAVDRMTPPDQSSIGDATNMRPRQVEPCLSMDADDATATERSDNTYDGIGSTNRPRNVYVPSDAVSMSGGTNPNEQGE